jgi:hypothetical protein
MIKNFNFIFLELIRPFLSSLINLFVTFEICSTFKFRIFEFLCNYFYKTESLK